MSKAKEYSKTPLATKLFEQPESIDPQSSCYIFGKLPIEVRELIWRFTLTRYEDLNDPYALDERCARPGQAAPLRIDLDLLLTCRAAYVETFLLPFQLNSLLVHDGDWDDLPHKVALLCLPNNLLRCSQLKPWQLAQISSVEMTVQQYALEGGSVDRVSRLVGAQPRHKGHESRGHTLQNYASFVPPRPDETQNLFVGRKITNLTIRMSRTDWWSWSSSPDEGEESASERLRLEPMVNTTSYHFVHAMTQGYEARKEGREPEFGLDDFEKQGRWGSLLSEYWPDLKTFNLVLETFACKKDQLDYVVKCAKLWTFPLEDGYHLVWDGKEESLRWRGASYYGYEVREPWIEMGNTTESGVGVGTPISWSPNEDGDDASQEFIIKTLTFERRKNEDR
ncbi:hypothetical protein GGR52DRAFT_567488 [Hypoxylon sp. FL1284]|nr:hypothetical protein GGR52DRAFT_567488 [Hypoxylon sp. FL1284]